MSARSRVSNLLVLAAFVAVPQLAAARDGADDSLKFQTPSIPVPTGVEVKTDSSGRRTFRVETPKALPSVSPGTGKVLSAQFCARFTDATGGVNTDVTKRFNELQTQFGKRGDKIKSDFKTVTDTQNANRDKADGALKSKFTDLKSKATTAEQKQAVADFEAAVSSAVTARRAAVDAANAAFKQGLLDTNSTRQTALKQAATTYKTAVAAAIAAAKTSCAAGTDPQTVRNTLKTALEDAKAKLEAARQAVGKNDTNLDALKATRKAAVDKANADFKAAIKAALDKLKAALGATGDATPSPSSSPETSATPTPTVAP